MSLRSLSDKALLSQTIRLTRRERETTLEILRHVNEIERRGLHLRLGYSSLFTYCTEHLGYSASGAGRRVQASRCIRKFPQAGRLLRRGRVNLTTLSAIAGALTDENADSLLARIEGKTQREVDAIAAELRPLSRVPDRVKPVCLRVPVGSAEATRPVNGGLLAGAGSVPDQESGAIAPGLEAERHDAAETGRGYSQTGSRLELSNTQLLRKMLIQFAANTDFMRKVEKVRSLLSTKIPAGATFEQIFEAGLDAFIEKHDPQARAERRARRAEKQSEKDQRTGKKESPRQLAQGDVATAAAAKPLGQTQAAAKALGQTQAHEPAERSESGPQQSQQTALATIEPSRKQSTAIAKEPSRYIPPAIRDAVYTRDGGRCTFIGATGKRCGSRHNLHVDHIVPFANGGSNALSNLRLLCANHNRAEAERVLGSGVRRRERPEQRL